MEMALAAAADRAGLRLNHAAQRRAGNRRTQTFKVAHALNPRVRPGGYPMLQSRNEKGPPRVEAAPFSQAVSPFRPEGDQPAS
ncbi:hypothetical protein GCM10010989_09200 [Croceicoccus pelagius]|uniref:Uncharacterized protein n=1 Tax=Croceicoccus pelagius TaxID=1703341 RepID=A0A917DG00_9SPHN|nr:hypothetical protein GCM10010989_09200 [Croceicoccus pelagius]